MLEWNWVDIGTYLNESWAVKNAVVAGLAISVVPGIFSAIAADNDVIKIKSAIWITLISYFIGAILGFLLSIIPTHDLLLRIKIAKIKNEAVSKENIDKGLEALERVTKKLECKYLGCEKEDK